jgi:hypothetical protein
MRPYHAVCAMTASKKVFAAPKQRAIEDKESHLS